MITVTNHELHHIHFAKCISAYNIQKTAKTIKKYLEIPFFIRFLSENISIRNGLKCSANQVCIQEVGLKT